MCQQQGIRVVCVFPPPGSVRFGEATDHRGKVWRWEFHEWMGPSFLRKDGELLARQPGPKSPAWELFYRWQRDTPPGPPLAGGE
jgi:hypothetical protein